MRSHIVITGTGRTGTSFLVQLFTRLGLDTGFSPENMDPEMDDVGRAGLESDIRDSSAPYIVKSPNISNYIHEILEDPGIVLDMVIVPLRDIEAAANSRVRVSEENVKKRGWPGRWFASKRGHAGGMIMTSDPVKQQFILLKSLSHLLVQCAKHAQPVMLLHYPRLIKDSGYLYSNLRPMLNGISETEFMAAFSDVVRAERVGSYSERDN